jgi:hypothetical protein
VSRAKQFAGQPGITLDEVALRASGMTPAQIASLRQRLGLTGPTGGVVSDRESVAVIVRRGFNSRALSDDDVEALMRRMAFVGWERDLGLSFPSGNPQSDQGITSDDDDDSTDTEGPVGDSVSTAGLTAGQIAEGIAGITGVGNIGLSGALGGPGQGPGPGPGPGDTGGVGPDGGEW